MAAGAAAAGMEVMVSTAAVGTAVMVSTVASMAVAAAGEQGALN